MVRYGLYCQSCPDDVAGGACWEVDDEFPMWCGTHNAPIRFDRDAVRKAVCEAVA